MYKTVYEEHGINNSDFPFIFYNGVNYLEKRDDLLNWHTNIEIFCCIRGKGTIICEAEKYELSQGEIFVVNSGYLHGVATAQNMICHCLIVDKVFFDTNGFSFDTLNIQGLIRDKALFSEFTKIVDAFESTGKYKNPVIKHSILGFLISLCSSYSTESFDEDRGSNNSQRIKNIIKYIKKNISSPLTLDEIASSVGVSKYHLTREFKKYTDCTVFEQINIIRCNEAKRLIKEGMSVSSAALSCGFSNMSYFARTYKKYIGMLPSESVKKK